MPIEAVLDHVAIAVPPGQGAERRWRDQLGGSPLWVGDMGTFQTAQIGFGNGGTLELLRPSARDPSPGNFVRRFLDRFGSAVHHVTLKVPDLPAAIDVVRRGGLDVVDVRLDDPEWREAFLRPSQVGGLVVQLASSTLPPPSPVAPDGAAALLGPTLRHPHLATTAARWSLLGARVRRTADELTCRWPASPLDVVVRRGAPAGPLGLRMTGTPPLSAEDGVGPAVLVTLG